MPKRIALTAVLLAALLVSFAASRVTSQPSEPSAALMAEAEAKGTARVIVHLRTPFVPEHVLPTRAHIVVQRQDIARFRGHVRDGLRGIRHRIVREYDALPFVTLEVGPDALRMLASLRGVVTHVQKDELAAPMLAESIPLIQGDQAWALGFDGTGQIVAILDSGVDKNHAFLAGKVVGEACFSTTSAANGTTSLCPGSITEGTHTSTAVDSALPCASNIFGCDHGTNVAGIAAGSGAQFSGVARGAKILAIQVFSRIDSLALCGGTNAPCLRSFTSDQLAALNHVFTVRNSFPGLTVAAANLSAAGSTPYSSTVVCDGDNISRKLAIDQLKSAGIATTLPAGNLALVGSLNAPACISTAVSVGATLDGTIDPFGAMPADTVAAFSNTAPFLSLLAPGIWINSSTPGGAFTNFAGTSQASAHVAGAFAVLRQAAPTASVDTVLQALQNTGLQIADARANPAIVKSRIRVGGAIAALAPSVPQITSLNPASVAVNGPAFTLTVNGTNFGLTSVVQVNGVARATTFVNGTQLTAPILASDIAAPATSLGIVVVTPGAGGGTSNTATLTITGGVAPQITSLNPASVNANGPAFTLTVNGTNFGPTSVVQVNGAARATTFVNGTQLTASILAGDIATAATSLSIVVVTPGAGGGTSNTATLTITHTVALNATPATGQPGSALTVTLTNWTGGSLDWLALAPVGTPNTSYLTYVYANGLPGAGGTKTWTTTRPMALGQYEVRLLLNNGYVSGATSNTITVANINPTPVINGLNPTGVAAGSAAFALTVNGTGFVNGATATVGGQARVVTFVNSTQLTIAVLVGDVANVGPVPVVVTNPGQCGAGGCVSNIAQLQVTPPPAAPVLNAINPATVAAGGADFTLTATGTNFAPASVVRVNGNARATTYDSPTQLRATLLASDIAQGANLNVTVFTPAPGGGTSGIQTLVVTGPALNAAPTPGPPGSALTVTLTNWSGGPTDWLALAPAGSPNTTYVTYVYPNTLPGAGGTKTWTTTMPATLGQYVARLFPNNGYVTAATSNTITVANINPTPVINGLNPAGVAAGSAGFALTVNGIGFVNGATATVGGVARTVTFGNSTQLTIAVQAADVTAIGSVPVVVTNPGQCANSVCVSNTVALQVTAPPAAPVLNSINPTGVGAGGANFTLTATGTNFAPNSVVRVNGTPRATTYDSPTQLRATILAGDIGSSGNVSITVFTPAPGGGTSGAQTLAVTGPGLNATPSTGPPGSQLTVTLTNWGGGTADWLALAPVGSANTTYLTYVYPNTLPGAGGTKTWTTTMPVTLGQYEVRLFPNNGYVSAATSNTITVANINPTPVINGLNPTGVAAGSAGFALTVNGSGFVNGATATVGGVGRTVTFVSGTQLTVALLAADVTAIGSVNVVVTNPGQCANSVCVSNTVALQVTAPPVAPVLNAINPTTAAAGGGNFTLTATGTNFAPNSVVRVNGTARATTFVNSTTLTATILAGDIGSSGNVSITVFTPAPGGGTSGAQTLVVTGPGLNAAPAAGPPGSALTVTLTNWSGGTLDWLALAQVGSPNTSYLTYVYPNTLPGAGGTKTWTTTMPLALGQYEVRLLLNNGYVSGATSNAITVANINPAPVINGLNPSGVAAGSGAFALTVTGTGFVNGATATVGGVARVVTFVNSTQLTIAVLIGDVANVGNVNVVVTNPGQCVAPGCVSNTAQLQVTAPPPAPVLNAINPTTKAAGGAAFTLTATGTNFAPNSVVRVNGVARATTYDSPSQLRATILAGDIGSSGNVSITVFTPAPGGGTSGAQTLAVTGPALSAAPAAGPPGSALTVTLTNWGGGTTDWLALAPVGSANTTYLTYVYPNTLPGAGGTKTWTTTMPLTLGQYEVRLFPNNGYVSAATSNTITVANINPTPVINGLNPTGVAAGNGAFALTVNGSGFVNGATATVGGQARVVTFVNSTQLTIAVLVGDVANVGNVNVVVTNPAQCANSVCVSNAVALAVTAPPAAPGLTSINPTSVGAGGAAFTLTATGTNFAPNSVVRVNGVARATTYDSPTQLRATILAGDIGQAGNVSITVFTPAPGGGTSAAQTLTVTPPAGPTLSAAPGAGAPGSQLVVTLTNWGGGSSFDWLAIAPVGSPNTTYGAYAYVSGLPGAGGTKTWTTTMPLAPGQYEVRLLLNNGFVGAATSNTFTVTPP